MAMLRQQPGFRFLTWLQRSLLLAVTAPRAPAQSRPLLIIHNAHVFDGQAVVERADVLVKGGVIKAFGPKLKKPRKADPPCISSILFGASMGVRVKVGSSFLQPTNSSERGISMFVRIVEMNAKTGKGKELARTINDQVLTLLKNQPGFVDELVLVSPDNPDREVALSFWQSREDAEKYNREAFPKVNELMRNALESAPQVRTFDVVTSTAHKIIPTKAA